MRRGAGTGGSCEAASSRISALVRVCNKEVGRTEIQSLYRALWQISGTLDSFVHVGGMQKHGDGSWRVTKLP